MAKWSGLLPPGSVVLLEGAIRRLQIIGLAQADEKTFELFDYAAVPFPEGYSGKDAVIRFQRKDVEKIYAVGHLDENVYELLDAAEQRLDDLREGRITLEESRKIPFKKGAAHEV